MLESCFLLLGEKETNCCWKCFSTTLPVFSYWPYFYLFLEVIMVSFWDFLMLAKESSFWTPDAHLHPSAVLGPSFIACLIDGIEQQ